MNAIWKPTLEQQRKKRRNRQLLLAGILVSLALTVYAYIPSYPEPETIPTEQSEAAQQLAAQPTEPEPETAAPVKPDNILAKDITDGDTLSSIFDGFGINQTTMYQILATDEPYLALDVLRPGNKLTFTLDKTTRQLLSMELYIHPGKKVIYQRVDDENFEYQEINLPGVWEQELLSGEIKGSFYLSAMATGLTENEAANIADMFDSRLDFCREIRAGDHFEVVRSRQFVDGEFSGQSQILGARISGRNYHHDAFLFDDGNYYDHEGKSLARAFRRYPFAGHYRVSSPFNPRRLHPITHRISPHNGTDFAMPIGTAVLAAGDGVVTRVKNHPFAGKYIEIQHGGNYQTRYLHLSRIMVKRGQHVKRGQRIALSGNTGRSTGAHLHYELHVKGRVVNPLRAKIPMTAGIPKAKLPQFSARVSELSALMNSRDTEHQQIATSHSESNHESI